ncbi:collagen-like triple helix repeat-containing protein [Gordonia soli]|uniref:Clp R domain-containing protein n=1 Tax=Gordonia soli NBRC 108243 TaxID=1223545 RepID=M0QH65_9ACTN|nr:Clp protease N-terminal domain-containing protein [Gordonia soli]GAC67970.1 hypothetical protein GS4_11_02400 [Gordonia soli NBRC 108243]
MFDRFDREDRMLLVFATNEAADLGHRQLGTDHLILGMLCNARSPLFGVLGSQGLNLADARDAVRTFHEQDTEEQGGDGADEATARDRYDEDREALRSIGIDLDAVREAVRSKFGEDLSDGWADRGGDRGRFRGGDPRGDRGRGRGRGHRHGHGHGPHRGRGEGAYGPFGAEGPFGPRGPFGPEGPFGPDGPFGANGAFGARGAFGGREPGDWGGPFPRPEGAGPDAEMPGRPWGGPFDGPWEPGRGRRGPRGRGNRPRFSRDVKAAFGAAVEIARGHEDRLRPEYLLLGIIESGDAASRALIESVTTVDDLKAAVTASLPPLDTKA